MEEGKNKIHIIPTDKPLMVAMAVTLAFEAAFLFLVMLIDIIPVKIMGLMLIVIIGADVGATILMAGSRKHENRKLTGAIICVLVCLMMITGLYYLYVTYDAFAKLGAGLAQYERYKVIALKDGNYDKVEDIADEDVYVVRSNSKSYSDAQGRLSTKVPVKFREEASCISLGENMIDSKGMKHDTLLFIDDSRYQMIDEEIEGFEKETKVIYTVKVPVKTDNSASDIDVTKDSFNVFISGSDSRNGIEETARSDVNMVMTINPETDTILLTSMPRDSYVPLHMNGEMDKLTHAGVYGINESITTVEDWLDIDIDFYVKVDFDMLVNLVNAVDGIDVYSDYAFDSAVTDWTYEKGWNHMSGKKALYFARERKAFKAQDQQRIVHQQKVMKALIKKITQNKALVARYSQLVKAVENDMQTNFGKNNLSRLAKMQLSEMPKWEIKMQSVKGKGAEMGTYSMGFGRPLYVSMPNEKSVERVKQKIHEVQYPVIE